MTSVSTASPAMMAALDRDASIEATSTSRPHPSPSETIVAAQNGITAAR